jgi:hypothetical protein
VVGVAVIEVLAVDAALGQDGLGFVIEAVALPGLRGEDADVLQDAHGRDAVDDYLSALPAGAEGQVLVAPPGRGIGLGRRQDVLLRQAAGLHDVLQAVRGPGRGCPADCERYPQGQGQGTPCDLLHGYPPNSGLRGPTGDQHESRWADAPWRLAWGSSLGSRTAQDDRRRAHASCQTPPECDLICVNSRGGCGISPELGREPPGQERGSWNVGATAGVWSRPPKPDGGVRKQKG